jgi:hypothetical protein
MGDLDVIFLSGVFRQRIERHDSQVGSSAWAKAGGRQNPELQGTGPGIGKPVADLETRAAGEYRPAQVFPS